MVLEFNRWEDATKEQLLNVFMTYFDELLEAAKSMGYEMFTVCDEGLVTHSAPVTLTLMTACLAVDTLRKHHRISSAGTAHALSDLGYKPERKAVLKLIAAYEGDNIEGEFKRSRDRVFDVVRLLSAAD